jgi:DNA mismatch repair protein MutL
MAKKIRLLPESVITSIAAGEVVERPATVVKELMENAIDAGANQIDIFLEDHGLKTIRVTDNGEGIAIEDLPLAVQRHSTSKIFHSADLQNIRTLGFRGEALASIGSVSTLTLQSRQKSSTSGAVITVDRGEVGEITPLGMPIGTTVTVEHLFSYVPARRKFLKQPTTELRHTIEVVTLAALAHPEIGFTLQHGSKNILHTLAQTDPALRLTELLAEPIN